MAVAVTTRGYDNFRTGANTQESALTADAVGVRGIRRLFSLHVQGDQRGVEAQPLVMPGVRVGDGTTRDVIYLATMANQLCAFAASDGTQLWARGLGTPIKSNNDIDLHVINDHWGILSTPVIDPATATMYAVAWTSPDGSVANAQHFLHAVSIRDGSAVHPPLNLEGARYDPGHGLPALQFSSAARKQRASLLLTTVAGVTTVFIGFGSLKESSDVSRGWVIACGTEPFQITAAWASTARGHGAGIWHAGAGLAADPQGFIYAMTGNGNFDGVTDWGESFLKLQYAPPGAGAGGSLRVVDWWTPWTDGARVGQGAPAANRAAPSPTNKRSFPQTADGWDDMDLGSGGPVVIPSIGVLVGAGKDGILYVLDHARMGKTTPASLDNPATNYGKLKSPPIFFTYFPPTLNPAPQDITTLNLLFAGRSHHLHGSPLFWNSPDLGPVLYCWGENGNLRAWSIDNKGKVTYLACGAEQASAQATVPPGGMPGGMLTLSADGTRPHTGIVWAAIPYLDANLHNGPGRLLAYDATRFGTFADGSKQLRVLWDSQDWGLTFTFNKFNLPVVANGRLVVPTYEGRVDVYGL